MTRLLATLAFVALASSPVRAEGTAPGDVKVASDEPKLTIMWAPIRLIIPLFEVTAEYAITNKMGVSVTLGGGKRTIEGAGTEIEGTELEAGLQFRYYVLGTFSHGMELGVEVLEENVTFEEPLPPTILAVAAGGTTAGAFVGYKVATRVGFTFEAQLGARYLVREPGVTGVGQPMIEESKWAPLLHLNVGWSF